MTTYDPAAAAAVLFHPLADPERRELAPIDALVAGHDLRILLGIGEADAVRHARRAGWTWEEIADAAGISRQSAHARWRAAAYALDQAPDVEVLDHRAGCKCGMTAACSTHLVEPAKPAKPGRQQPKRRRK
jgi:hypothetical protein